LSKERKHKKDRIPKTRDQKLYDLDGHLFLLRQNLRELKGNPTYLKIVSAELRALVCKSSGTEGLLWRLVDELGINDKIFLHVQGKLKQDHPLAQGLQFAIVPIQRGGKGDPRLPPNHYSLNYVIKECEALVVKGYPLSHEYLIKAISQQMGTAHEDDGLEPALVDLKSIFINGIEPFVLVLAMDAELTLEIGERIIEHAEKHLCFNRVHHKYNYGNVTIVLRLRIRQLLAGRIPLLVFRSYVSEVDIECAAGPTGVSFICKKHDRHVGELLSPYPKDWIPGHDAVFVFSYCSRSQQARVIINGEAHNIVDSFNLGWLHASDLYLEQNYVEHIYFVEKQFLLIYERLLSSKDSQGLHELPPNGYGLWKYGDEIIDEGVFPE
jgi:hypothetical protein